MTSRGYTTFPAADPNDERMSEDLDQRRIQQLRETQTPIFMTVNAGKVLLLAGVFLVTIFTITFLILDSSDDGSNPNVVDTQQQFTELDVKFVLSNLQSLADSSEGSRAVQTGYNLSLEYVASGLSEGGWELQQQLFEVTTWKLDSSSLVDTTHGVSFLPEQDFKVVLYSGNTGDSPVSGKVTFLESFGCEADDYSSIDSSTSVIVLIQTGNCTTTEKLQAALDSEINLSALLISVSTGSKNLVIDSLSELERTPVLSVSQSTANWLAWYDSRSTNPATFEISISTTLTSQFTSNLIASWPEGDPEQQVLFGAQLDSPLNSAGINNNGVAVAILYEYGKTFGDYNLDVKNQPVLCFWSAGELGHAGSNTYVSIRKSEGSLPNIAAYLNFDTIGSPNALPQVYDASLLSLDIRNASNTLSQILSKNYPGRAPYSAGQWQEEWNSDWNAFASAGIPVSGYFSGTTSLKTPGEADEWKGFSNALYDPCYQNICDSFGNYQTKTIAEMITGIVGSANYLIQYSDLNKIL